MRDPIRVAIVGAGPAGLTVAWHLKQLGLRSVEVFDGADNVGGQSVTRNVDGVLVELGTCYLSEGYRIVEDIAAEVGCPAVRLPPATMLDDSGRATTHGSPDMRMIGRFILHWLRWYFAGQMQRPTHPDNSLRFDGWLEARGLGALAAEFTFAAGLTAQLYGPIPEVTSHSALNWERAWSNPNRSAWREAGPGRRRTWTRRAFRRRRTPT